MEIAKTQPQKKFKDISTLTSKYAEALLEKEALPLKGIYDKAEGDLKYEFGDAWNRLETNSREFLFTAMVSYISFKSLGNDKLDFTSSIIPVTKALETECKKYLFTGYVEYLKKNNVPITQFKTQRDFIVRDGTYSFKYCDTDKVEKLALGRLDNVLGVEKKKAETREVAENGRDKEKKLQSTKLSAPYRKIDDSALAYLKTIFKEEEFGNSNIDRAITEYICGFVEQTKTITELFRNPAAHSTRMSCYTAEITLDYLIKKNRLICDFLEKLKDEEK